MSSEKRNLYILLVFLIISVVAFVNRFFLLSIPILMVGMYSIFKPKNSKVVRRKIKSDDIYLRFNGKQVHIFDGLTIGRGNGINSLFTKKLYLSPLSGDRRIPLKFASIRKASRKNGYFLVKQKNKPIYVEINDEIREVKKSMRLKPGMRLYFLNNAYVVDVEKKEGGNNGSQFLLLEG